MNSDQIKYYSERAEEYEKIYSKPERQSDLAQISQYLKNQFRDKRVREIACGTGYWTRIISETAASIFAGDINSSVIKIAGSKVYECPVKFQTEDIFSLSDHHDQINAGFAGFIWSHILKDDLPRLLNKFLQLFNQGAEIIFIDNNFVEGSSTPLAEYDDAGNTYQVRKLEDGSEHKVLKNFPSDDELETAVKPYADEIEIKRLQYFWILKVNAG